MSNVIVALVVIALLLFAVSLTGQAAFKAIDMLSGSWEQMAVRAGEIERTDIDIASAVYDANVAHVTIKNSGHTPLVDFDSWDVVTQYYDNGGTYHQIWLPYTSASNPGDNQWTVAGIYEDASTLTPETFQPGILNSQEEMLTTLKLNPQPAGIEGAHSHWVVIGTHNGVSVSALLQAQMLYLHNNPTPPTGNTRRQAALPMSGTSPTATVLYNYDTDSDSAAGRLIKQSDNGLGETNLANYQNWRMPIAFGKARQVKGDVKLILWSGMKNFGQSKRGVVTAYLRDWDGSSYTEIANATLDLSNWQSGSSTWVERTVTLSNISYTVPASHYLEVKLLVTGDSDDDMWFAYDTTNYPSRIQLP